MSEKGLLDMLSAPSDCYPDPPESLAPLEVPCEVCGGEGVLRPDYFSPPREVGCHACDGFGRVPTELGARVLAFVSARLRLRVTAGA
jgi:hypothetical protein